MPGHTARTLCALTAAAVALAGRLPLAGAVRYGEADPKSKSDGTGGTAIGQLDGNGDGRANLKELLASLAGASAGANQAGNTDDAQVLEALLSELADGDANVDGSMESTEAQDFVGGLPMRPQLLMPTATGLKMQEGVGHGQVEEAGEDEEDEDDGDEDGDARARAISGLFRALDLDSDGRVDQQEIEDATAPSAEGVKLLGGLFTAADLNQDGTLDRHEAEHFLQLADVDVVSDERAAQGGSGDSESGMADALDNLFGRLDKNDDGQLQREELAEPAAGHDVDAGLVEALLHGFEAADTDHDGALKEGEVAEFIGALPAEGLVEPLSIKGGDDFVAFDDDEEDGGETGAGVIADMFRALDHDGDGKIEKKDILAAAQQEADPGMAASVDDLFEQADADNDGRLDRKEAETFLELLSGRAAAEEAATPTRDVRKQTGDKDIAASAPAPAEALEARRHVVEGAMGAPEIAEYIGGLPAGAEVGAMALQGADEFVPFDDEDSERGNGDLMADMFRLFDPNSDGKIELKDITAAVLEQGASHSVAVNLVHRLFGQADTDGDGSLARQEAETFLALWSAHDGPGKTAPTKQQWPRRSVFHGGGSTY